MPWYHSLVLVVALFSEPEAADSWPDFRGPRGDGHSDAVGLPVTWSEAENIKWKTQIPGRGWSSPVIWGDQVWMTTAKNIGRELFAVGVDKNTGKILFNVKVFDVLQPQPIDPLNSYASPSPVIESGRVYVHFGTYGTACIETHSGRVLWRRRDFKLEHRKGPGSSPILFGKVLILQCDGDDFQYLVGLDKITGKTVWKTDRSVDYSKYHPECRKSFSTPFVVEIGGKTQVISTAAHAAFAHDALTGKELWKMAYPGHTNVSRTVVGNGMAYINTGYPLPQLWAIRLGGTGEISRTQVAWKVTRSVSIKPSILLVDGYIYMVADTGGIVTCLNAGTGQVVWKNRLGGNYSASPIVAEDLIYFFCHEGKTTVIKADRKFQVLAANHLESGFMASPAVSGKAIYLRTKASLYRIEEQ